MADDLQELRDKYLQTDDLADIRGKYVDPGIKGMLSTGLRPAIEKAVPAAGAMLGGPAGAQAASGLVDSLTMGYVKPRIEAPADMAQRLAHASGSVAGFIIPFSRLTAVLKTPALAGAIIGLASDTNNPLGSREDWVARAKSAGYMGAQMWALGKAGEFVDEKVTSRLLDGALRNVANDPGKAAILSRLLNDMTLGAGLGASEPTGQERTLSQMTGKQLPDFLNISVPFSSKNPKMEVEQRIANGIIGMISAPIGGSIADQLGRKAAQGDMARHADVMGATQGELNKRFGTPQEQGPSGDYPEGGWQFTPDVTGVKPEKGMEFMKFLYPETYAKGISNNMDRLKAEEAAKVVDRDVAGVSSATSNAGELAQNPADPGSATQDEVLNGKVAVVYDKIRNDNNISKMAEALHTPEAKQYFDQELKTIARRHVDGEKGLDPITRAAYTFSDWMDHALLQSKIDMASPEKQVSVTDLTESQKRALVDVKPDRQSLDTHADTNFKGVPTFSAQEQAIKETFPGLTLDQVKSIYSGGSGDIEKTIKQKVSEMFQNETIARLVGASMREGVGQKVVVDRMLRSLKRVGLDVTDSHAEAVKGYIRDEMKARGINAKNEGAKQDLADSTGNVVVPASDVKPEVIELAKDLSEELAANSDVVKALEATAKRSMFGKAGGPGAAVAKTWAEFFYDKANQATRRSDLPPAIQDLDKWAANHEKLSLEVSKHEKSELTQPVTPEQEALRGDWKAFSRARGYSASEIKQYQTYLDSVQKGADLAQRAFGYSRQEALDEVQRVEVESHVMDQTRSGAKEAAAKEELIAYLNGKEPAEGDVDDNISTGQSERAIDKLLSGRIPTQSPHEVNGVPGQFDPPRVAAGVTNERPLYVVINRRISKYGKETSAKGLRGEAETKKPQAVFLYTSHARALDALKPHINPDTASVLVELRGDKFLEYAQNNDNLRVSSGEHDGQFLLELFGEGRYLPKDTYVGVQYTDMAPSKIVGAWVSKAMPEGASVERLVISPRSNQAVDPSEQDNVDGYMQRVDDATRAHLNQIHKDSDIQMPDMSVVMMHNVHADMSRTIGMGDGTKTLGESILDGVLGVTSVFDPRVAPESDYAAEAAQTIQDPAFYESMLTKLKADGVVRADATIGDSVQKAFTPTTSKPFEQQMKDLSQGWLYPPLARDYVSLKGLQDGAKRGQVGFKELSRMAVRLAAKYPGSTFVPDEFGRIKFEGLKNLSPEDKPLKQYLVAQMSRELAKYGKTQPAEIKAEIKKMQDNLKPMQDIYDQAVQTLKTGAGKQALGLTLVRARAVLESEYVQERYGFKKPRDVNEALVQYKAYIDGEMKTLTRAEALANMRYRSIVLYDKGGEKIGEIARELGPAGVEYKGRTHGRDIASATAHLNEMNRYRGQIEMLDRMLKLTDTFDSAMKGQPLSVGDFHVTGDPTADYQRHIQGMADQKTKLSEEIEKTGGRLKSTQDPQEKALLQQTLTDLITEHGQLDAQSTRFGILDAMRANLKTAASSASSFEDAGWDTIAFRTKESAPIAELFSERSDFATDNIGDEAFFKAQREIERLNAEEDIASQNQGFEPIGGGAAGGWGDFVRNADPGFFDKLLEHATSGLIVDPPPADAQEVMKQVQFEKDLKGGQLGPAEFLRRLMSKMEAKQETGQLLASRLTNDFEKKLKGELRLQSLDDQYDWKAMTFGERVVKGIGYWLDFFNGKVSKDAEAMRKANEPKFVDFVRAAEAVYFPDVKNFDKFEWTKRATTEKLPNGLTRQEHFLTQPENYQRLVLEYRRMLTEKREAGIGLGVYTEKVRGADAELGYVHAVPLDDKTGMPFSNAFKMGDPTMKDTISKSHGLNDEGEYAGKKTSIDDRLKTGHREELNPVVTLRHYMSDFVNRSSAEYLIRNLENSHAEDGLPLMMFKGEKTPYRTATGMTVDRAMVGDQRVQVKREIGALQRYNETAFVHPDLKDGLEDAFARGSGFRMPAFLARYKAFNKAVTLWSIGDNMMYLYGAATGAMGITKATEKLGKVLLGQPLNLDHLELEATQSGWRGSSQDFISSMYDDWTIKPDMSPESKSLMKRAWNTLEFMAKDKFGLDGFLYKTVRTISLSMWEAKRNEILEKGGDRETAGRLAADYVNTVTFNRPRYALDKNTSEAARWLLISRNMAAARIATLTGAFGYTDLGKMTGRPELSKLDKWFSRNFGLHGYTDSELKTLKSTYVQHWQRIAVSHLLGTAVISNMMTGSWPWEREMRDWFKIGTPMKDEKGNGILISNPMLKDFTDNQAFWEIPVDVLTGHGTRYLINKGDMTISALAEVLQGSKITAYGTQPIAEQGAPFDKQVEAAMQHIFVDKGPLNPMRQFITGSPADIDPLQSLAAIMGFSPSKSLGGVGPASVEYMKNLEKERYYKFLRGQAEKQLDEYRKSGDPRYGALLAKLKTTPQAIMSETLKNADPLAYQKKQLQRNAKLYTRLDSAEELING